MSEDKPDNVTQLSILKQDRERAEAEADAAEQAQRAPDPEETEGLPEGGTMVSNRHALVTGNAERRDGVYMRSGKGWAFLSSPLRVLAKVSSPDAQESWGRLIEWTTPAGTTQRQAIKASVLATNYADLLAQLADRGVEFGTGQNITAKALCDYIRTADTEERVVCVERVGWHGETYITPGHRFGPEGAPEAVYFGPPVRSAHYEQRGTVDQWRDGIAALAIGNPMLMFAISVSFAGPLLKATGTESGGFHLVGQSAGGKTTMLRCAASVWGRGTGHPRFVGTWRATGNGLEATAAEHNDGVLILDEIGQCSPFDVGEVVYMLGNEHGKMRANRGGDARQPKTWRIMALSSGETEIAAAMAEVRKRVKAGQETRLPAIPATNRAHGAFDELHGADLPSEFADRLKRQTGESFGTVGTTFLEKIVEYDFLPPVSACMERFKARGRGQQRFSGQVDRVLERFALVAAAGELATYLGLTGWTRRDAFGAALEVFNLFLDHRGGTGEIEVDQAEDRLRAFIDTHGSSRFQRWETTCTACKGAGTWRDPIGETRDCKTCGGTGEHEERLRDQAGAYRDEDGQRAYYFTATAWRKHIIAGGDASSINAGLAVLGLLKKAEGDGKHSVSRKIPSIAGGSAKRFYRVVIPTESAPQGGDDWELDA